MGYKVYYSYQKYENCPEATEISKSRSQFIAMIGWIFVIIPLGLIIFGVAELGKDTVKGILFIVGGILSIPLIFFLYNLYLNRTDYLVKNAIKRQNERNENRIEAFRNHDTETLVNLNETKKWVITKDVIKDYDLHVKWVLGDPRGKRIEMVGESISDMKLKDMCFSNAIFSHCVFSRLDLRTVQFRGCDLSYSIFDRCKMRGTVIDDCNIDGVQYSKCDK